MPLDDLRQDIVLLLLLLFIELAVAAALILRSNCAGFEPGCSNTCCNNKTHRSHCRSAGVLLVTAEDDDVADDGADAELLVPLLLALVVAAITTSCGEASSLLSCHDGID